MIKCNNTIHKNTTKMETLCQVNINFKIIFLIDLFNKKKIFLKV